jgi:hypothetical protein
MDPKTMTPKELKDFKALGRKPINFKIKNYISKQEMFDYVQSNEYRSPSVSGLCFAVLINELPSNKGYNLEIFFNDHIAERAF